MTTRSKLILGGSGIVLAIACVLALQICNRWAQQRQATRALEASKHAAALQLALQDRDAYRSQAEGFLASLTTLKGTASTQAQEIARLKTQHPQLLDAPQDTPDPCPDLRNLAVKQDDLIQAQGIQLDTWEKRGAALEGQASASDHATQAATRQIQALQVQLAAIPPSRPWSLGPLLGVNIQGQLRLGVIASGAYGRVQGHALVLGDTAALGITIRF